MIVKINGERNSGTNFLKTLLKNNFDINVIEHERNNKITYFWKHSIPNPQIKIKYPNIIDFFVIRELDSWLVSMFHNPYHLIPSKNFNDFLTKTQNTSGDQIDGFSKKIINFDDKNKTIFQIRYHKLNKIIDYINNQDNIVFVNLSILQNDEKCKYFLEKISKKFNLPKKNNIFITNFPHFKNKNKNIKNRNYDTNIDQYRNLIDKMKNKKIEEQINNILIIKQNKILKKYLP